MNTLTPLSENLPTPVTPMHRVSKANDILDTL